MAMFVTKKAATLKTFVLALFLFALLAAPVPAPDMSGCTAKGIRLYGRVKVVTSFADLKVQIVNSFPDLKVQKVNSFPTSCGKWQFVDSFPDFTIQYVQSFPDIKVQFVNSFPGVP